MPESISSVFEEPAKVEYLANAWRIANGVNCAEVGESAVWNAGTPSYATSVFVDFNNLLARSQLGSFGKLAMGTSAILTILLLSTGRLSNRTLGNGNN